MDMPIDEKIIILDGLDFLWSKKDIEHVVSMHNKGYHIKDISKDINRNPAEVLLALVDVAVKGKVGIRPLVKR
ncbi:hypothetical protein SPD48_09595 [Pseudogracilibacillus sp. SE30717A]|uniref:hypothetical protein n=1 Tax=Pseudogracilibacillus sp. SE30717A TaxID=3098293 RepID=UPI00300E47D0